LTILKNIFLLIVGFLLCYQSEAQIFIDQKARGNNDGSSWEHAFTDLQDGLQQADESAQIWVAEGTYLPGKAGNPKSTSFEITKSIQLYGGFAGTENLLSERGPKAHPTILSGDLNQDDIAGELQTNRSDNVWNILKVHFTSQELPILDGFIIEGGHANGNPDVLHEARGGGIFSYGPIELRNCELRQNYAMKNGGALFFLDSTSVEDPLLIDHCLFDHNHSEGSGGAIEHRVIRKNSSGVSISNSIFQHNKTMNGGGAITNLISNPGCSFEFTDCLFEKNEGEMGGAIFHVVRTSHVKTEIIDCNFSANTSVNNFPKKVSTGGGAIRFQLLGNAKNCTGYVKGCTFSDNQSLIYGGALFIRSFQRSAHNKTVLDSCLFENNISNGGGAIAFSPQGIKDSFLLHHGTFSGNKAEDLKPKFSTAGGAILNLFQKGGQESWSQITTSTFHHNSCDGVGGGAIGILPASNANFTSISSCTFNENHTSGQGGAIFYDRISENYELEACTFYNNKAEGGDDIIHTHPSIDSSMFFIFNQGALWIQILFNLLLFFITRERTVWYFTVFVIGISWFNFFMYDIVYFSFFDAYPLSPGWLYTLRKIGVFIIITGGIKFIQSYLNINQFFPIVKKIVSYYFVIYFFIELTTILTTTNIIPLNDAIWERRLLLSWGWVTGLGFLSPFIGSILVLRKGYKPAWFLIPAFFMLSLSATYEVYLYTINTNPISDFDIILPQILALLAIVLLALANGHRTNLLKKNKDRAERLAELDIAKTRLYNNITHEFRTPLTVIMGSSEMIENNEQEKELIQRNSKQLLQLINQMLDMSKLEGGALKLQSRQGDIIPYITYLVESFQSLAASRDIQLTFSKEIDELQMDYDSEKVQAIVTNLISNAIKFTPISGKIMVQAKKEIIKQKPQLVLTVQDNGYGIPEADIQHIFNRFFQVDNSDIRRSEGTGIGLALVKELVQLMNGTINVSSKIDKGSVFTVQLPVTQLAPLEHAEVKPSAIFRPPEPASKVLSTSPTLSQTEELPLALIIEDNKDVVHFLKTCLQTSYQLEVAYNGREGIEKALEIVPDIIISDVMMPEADGFTVCKTLKADERTSHVPIIMLTAKATQEDKLRGLEMGADAYLNKPFHREELELRLHKLIELRRQLQAHYQAELDVPPGRSRKIDPFIEKLQQIIEENMEDESFGISELCDTVHLSRSQVHRKLKALIGMPITQFIHAVRLQKAYQLLQETDLNVSEVAYKVGFLDHSYFTRLFVRKYEKTPSEVGRG
jgi:signal transduction histidine kinase/DNA-binding response OmpR family regulator